MKWDHIYKNYRIALSNQLLHRTTLFFGLSSMCVYLYVACAPFIAISYLHMSPEKYGIVGFIPFIGTALGSIVSVRLVSLFSVTQLIKSGFIINVTAALLMTLLFSLGYMNILTLSTCGFILMFGNCLIVGGGSSIATSTSEDKANSSAIMNFINVGMVATGTFILALIPGSPIVKLPAGFLLGIIIMALVWIKLRKTTCFERSQSSTMQSN